MVCKIPGGGFYIGKEGGLLNAIVGSIFIVLGSTALGLLISIPIVFYINLYLPKKSFPGTFNKAFIRCVVWNSFYSIWCIWLYSYGLFRDENFSSGRNYYRYDAYYAYFSRSMDEVAQMVPRDLNDAIFSLGATKLEAIKVILRQISPGITTAILLSIGSAIGDAASVLFTAGYTDSIPTSLGPTCGHFPLAIFFQFSSPVEEVQNRAYAAAFILTMIVLALSLGARFYSRKFSKHKI